MQSLSQCRTGFGLVDIFLGPYHEQNAGGHLLDPRGENFYLRNVLSRRRAHVHGAIVANRQNQGMHGVESEAVSREKFRRF